jgi:hypothetical protein
MKRGLDGGKTQSPLTNGVRRPIQPHVLIFGFLCLLYLLPLWLVSLGSYDKGGVLGVGRDAHGVMTEIVVIYALGFASFWLGSWSVPRICWLLGARAVKRLGVANVHIQKSDLVLLIMLAVGFSLAKMLLIREGVYANYAFDTGNMDTPVWTASMFLSESLVLASLLALFSGRRHGILLFALLSVLNGVNLLHGTRNFFVIAILATAIYAYLRTRASLLKMGLYGAVLFFGAVSLAYAVFVSRSHVVGAEFSLLDILSPITYESVFSQMSLISLLNHPLSFDAMGSPLHLPKDVFLFSIPRALVGNKGELVWINQFGYLSPLGAFSGFATGLLYFGYLFPLFYYLLGVVAGMLYRLADNSYGAVLYLYFTCDFLYRIIRDGYVIPSKMLINSIEELLFLALFRSLVSAVQHVRFHRSVGPVLDAN